jgi:site-specific recombinase XerD
VADTFDNSWVDDWALSLSTGTVAAATREVYLRGVRQFLAWLADAHPEVVSPGQVTRRHVTGWLAALHEAAMSDATRLVRLKSLGLFFSWLADEPGSEVTDNPTAKIERPVARPPVVPVVPDDDVRRLLAGIRGHSFADLRDTAVIRLLFDAGLRRAELVGLDVVDVDLRDAVVHVMGKGRKPRATAVSPKTVLALSRYRRLRERHPGADDPAFFLTARTNAAGSWRLSGGGVAELLARRCRNVGLEPINPHRARHTATHALLAAGANESDVEQLMGWSTPDMVRRYGRAMAAERAIAAAHALKIGDRF